MGVGGGTYNVQASPMYQWQKQAMDNELSAQLAGIGIILLDSAQAALYKVTRYGSSWCPRIRQILNYADTNGIPLGQLAAD